MAKFTSLLDVTYLAAHSLARFGVMADFRSRYGRIKRNVDIVYIAFLTDLELMRLIFSKIARGNYINLYKFHCL